MVSDSADSRSADCFSLGTERYAMIPGWQNDAMDCFYIFCDSIDLSPGPECWIPTPEQMLQYPDGIDEEMQMSIGQLVDLVDANVPIMVSVPPKTFVLGLVPFKMRTETEAEWVVAAISGWDDTVDMSRFCLDRAQCTD